MSDPATSDTGEREIINIEEAAQLLGVSVKTFNKVLHSQSIPARKIGREWKFSRNALIEWVGAGRSDQFYRENNPENNGEKPRARKGQRRTSGWRLELDPSDDDTQTLEFLRKNSSESVQRPTDYSDLVCRISDFFEFKIGLLWHSLLMNFEKRA